MAADVRGLLSALEAAGARLAVGEGGSLELSGKWPPADLLRAVKAAKPAIVEALTVKEEAPSSSSPEDLAPWEDAGEVCPQVVESADTLTRAPVPDWAAVAGQPGRCGSCARAVDVSEEWGAYMVACTCDPVAWWPLPPPLALHIGARCGAYQMEGEEVGRGWRAKDTGKRYGPRPPAPSPLPDLGAA